MVNINQPIDWNIAQWYDELPMWSAPCGQLLLEWVPLSSNAQALDVGCGTGFPLVELAQRLGNDAFVTGLDAWQDAVEKAGARLRDQRIFNAKAVEGTAESMPLPAEQFDLIVSNLGINNFSDPQLALEECWRVAKPDAILAMTSNLRGHMAEFYQAYEHILRQLEVQAWLENLQEHIDRRITVNQMVALLEDTGWQTQKVVESQFVMRFATGSALLSHAFLRLAFLEGWKAVVPESRVLEVFAQLESHLNRLAEEQKGITLTIPIAYFEAVKLTTFE